MNDAAQKYPEIIADLADTLAAELVATGIPVEKAGQIGHKLAEHIRVHWGGRYIYIAKGLHYDLSNRDMQIWRDFTGNNVSALAGRYGLTEIHIYRILARARSLEQQRRQPELFPAPR